MGKIYYIGYYSDKNTNKKRNAAPSADTKMTYIAETLVDIGYDVEIVSFCEENFRGKLFEIYESYDTNNQNIKVHFFKTYTSKYRIIRFICRFFTWRAQKRYIKEKCINSDCKIIVYHSLNLLKLQKFLNQNKKEYILEMEEIYSDVNCVSLEKREKEINISNMAKAYIFPTEYLKKELNLNKKQCIIIHGTYKTENSSFKKIFTDDKVHCVYSGTLDLRKTGPLIEIAKFLPFNYCLHILGFGSRNQINNLIESIKKESNKENAMISYDGMLLGEEYVEFLQNCDIGLCTQDINASFNSTSFPSKILSYMCNDLRVVSANIPVIKESKIGRYIYFYDNSDPKEIAKIIRNIDLNDRYNGKEYINILNNEFHKDLEFFLANK